ncbi:MAG: hypothetical protein IKX37_05530 [Bacteroidales bacterium]|nr:hypothetical protein [Bacteroidales bacterium]
MKRFAIFMALSALLFVPVSLNAQRENKNLGKKYGPYEIKLGKGKWTSDSPVSAIWNNETKVWVTSPKIDKKGGALFFLPNTSVEFIEGDEYPAEAQGLVNIDWAFCWKKQVEYPNRAWFCNGECGVFKIENDQLVPIIESGNSLERAYKWEARYGFFKFVPHHALILGVFREKDKKAYSVFNLEGERLYNDVKDFEFLNHPSMYIQLEDGSWHHLDPDDGHMLD